MIDELSIQAFREEMEDMGMDEDSIDAAIEAMFGADEIDNG